MRELTQFDKGKTLLHFFYHDNYRTTVFVVGPWGFNHMRLVKICDYFLKNNNFYYITNTGKMLGRSLARYYNQTIYTLFFGYRIYMRIKGLGYYMKPFFEGKQLLLHFGKSEDEFTQLPENMEVGIKPRKKKYLYKFVSSNKILLKSFCKQLQIFNKPDIYRLKGLRFVSEYIKIRPGKKKK
jgi:large subunit ribosomal protein L6